MKLKELLLEMEVLELCADPELEITGVSYDSRQVKPGDTLLLEAELGSFRHGMGKANVKATVEGEVAAVGEIGFAIIENK